MKDKLSAFETRAAEKEKALAALTDQLKKNNPEEYKNYYEGKAKELEAKFQAELSAVTAERDKFQQDHYSRVQQDAIDEGVKNLAFLDGLRDGFVALAMTRNQFKPSSIDGKTVFTNQENKTIQAVLHELSMSKDGRVYLKNQNQGGGSGGSGTAQSGGTGGGNQMTKAQFDALTDQAKMDFATKGGTVVDSP